MTRLAALASTIASQLNSAPENTWSDLTVGSQPSDRVEAVVALDPINFRENLNEGLFIVPVVSQYSREGSQGRRGLVKLSKQPVISLVLSLRYCENSDDGIDVSSIEEVTQYLNLREEIDEYILGQDLGVGISNINAEAPQNTALDTKWFLSLTEIEFDVVGCT